MIESVSRPVAAIIVVLAAALFWACGLPASRTLDAGMAGTSFQATVDGLATYHEQIALPVTFTGTLPCADCEGIRHHLDLWPDGVFHLRRTYLGRPGGADDIGRWRRDPGRSAILLYGGREMPLQFEIKGPQTLRLLDIQGRPIQSSLPYELTGDDTLTPTDLRLALQGMFRYMADAARFEECLTGRSYPVAMEGDYITLERAYLQAAKPEPGAPLMASFEGEITRKPAMEGSALIPTVVVRRFIGVWPGQRCERAMSKASLPDQYWRIVSLGGEPVNVAEGRREPHMILRSEKNTYAATVGCNRLIGGYNVEGDRITFTAAAGTLMDCPPPLAAMEQRLLGALDAARSWSITGQVLELFDKTGAGIALFEAVYLR